MMNQFTRNFSLTRILLIPAIVCMTMVHALAQPGLWQDLTGFTGIPGERHESGFLQVGDKFYLVGGRNSQWKLVEEYDPVANTWTQGAFHPLQLHHVHAVAIDGLIYVVGAMTGEFPDETPVENVYIYEPISKTWYMGPEIPVARRRGAPGVVVYNNKIYIVGGIVNGHNSGHVPFLDVYDPSTNTWTALADAPRARDHFKAVLVGDEIYAVGGRRSKHNTTGLNSDMELLVDVYNLLTDTWTTLPAPLPTPRAGLMASAIGTQIFTFGGESDVLGDHAVTEALETTTGTWVSTYDDLTVGRHGTQSFVNNGVIYTGAGSMANAIEVLPGDPSFLEQFSPTATFTAPSLVPLSPGTLSPAVPSYDFGATSVGSTNTYSLELTNNSTNQGILLDGINISGDDSTQFSFAAPGGSTFAPISIPPGGSVFVTISFTPTSATDKSGTITFTHSGTNGNIVVPLTGEGCVGQPGTSNGAFVESGGIVMFQAEVITPIATSDWVQGTSGPDFFLQYTGSNNFDTPPAEVFTYEFTISTPGTYRFMVRSEQALPASPTSGNDVWISFPTNTVSAVKGMLPTPDEVTPLTGFFKVYQDTPGGFVWQASAEEFNDVGIYLDIPAGGTFSMLVAGRSADFSIDKYVLYTYAQALTDPELDALPQSPLVGTACVNTWYEDFDADTYGNAASTLDALTQPAGYVDNAGDCVDTDPTINAGALELLDGVDNDCDGAIDEGWFGTCPTIRINAGSDVPYTTAGGEVFAADQYFGANTSTFGVSGLAVANTLEDELYATTRSSNVDLGSMTYNIPVVNGPYTVNLHFTEVFFGVGGNAGGPLSRIFDVNIEGVAQLTAYDIAAEVGSAAAVIKSFSTTVVDNSLTILLDASSITSANRPIISAIEIVPEATCGAPNPFPVEYLSFEAKQIDEHIQLDWETAFESNNDFFTLERSNDGLLFEQVGVVDGAGNTQAAKAYRFIDERPSLGINYYRLKQTDLDGGFAYSNTIEVFFAEEKLRVFPNPVNSGGVLNISINSTTAADFTFEILNLMGQKILQESKAYSKGTHIHTMNTSKLKPGYYMLQLTNGNQKFISKISIVE